MQAGAVTGWSDGDKISEGLRRGVNQLAPAVKNQFAQLMTPTGLAVAAGFLVAWIVSHAVGIGKIIDVILLAAGAIFIGWAIFDAMDHIYQFGKISLDASQSADFDRAGRHFAQAVAIIGGLRELLTGIKFPVANGYVTLA